MKPIVNSFGFKLWRTFLFFAAIIFAVLLLLQTVLLQTCYTGMAVSGLKKAASKIAAQKDSEGFWDAIEEAARDNSLLIFLTDSSGQVLYSADAYSSLYSAPSYSSEENHSSGNPYFSAESTLSWEKGALRNLPNSHMELIEQLCFSDAASLGYTTENETAYVYGEKLGPCQALPGSDVIMCISMPLGSVAGTARILRVQLLWVSLFSFSLSCLLAFFFSCRFEKPIRGILEQAKDLARGDFHAAAHEGFCTELDHLSRALNGTADALRHLEHARQELLANISHDLRTPLTMIKGYAELIREFSWSDEEKRNQDLDIIIRESDRLTALVNEILEYSSMRSLHRKPDMTVFSLSGAVYNVIRQFDALCREQGFLIAQSIEPEVWVNGNRAQIERVIYNFIDNAINHAGSGQQIWVSL
ncbi:MAG: histidine kinase dimerization/phospho-acceptor domain-containing protein, partial [Faecousia sp.]